MTKKINIVVPIAGRGGAFQQAGYTFPKPLIDINGKTLIEIVVNNIKPKVPHRFIFILLHEHVEKYDMHNVLKRAAREPFETISIRGTTEGAACTAITAIEHINNDEELIIANSDQYIDGGINSFITAARKKDTSGTTPDGLIMTFPSTHPRWSYVRTNGSDVVIETAEKKVISNQATAGIYYFKKGSDFVNAAQAMILKNIRHNGEFYICPVYNELILAKKRVSVFSIDQKKMHSLGTPEDLRIFLHK